MTHSTIDSDPLLSLHFDILNTPNPGGRAEPVVTFTQQELMVFPERSLTRTSNGALVAARMGENSDILHMRNPSSTNPSSYPLTGY